MTIISSSRLIFLLPLIICYNIEGNVNRHQRQVSDGINRNLGVPQQKSDGSIPLNNLPFNPSNNPTLVSSNQQNNPKQPASQSQIQPVRSRGYYNNPLFQPPPFTGEKPSGWFGTNHPNWVSNQNTELDKNKLATINNAGPNNPQVNIVQPQREDGGPFFLQKVAKLYASKGEKAFNFGQFETRQGSGAVCFNYENFDGFVFNRYPCPLPPSTGMNQLDQFCCGPANYQYCCNAQEFSQSQRGAFDDHRFIDPQQQQRFPKQSSYPLPTRRILAVILPIAGFIVLTGIGILVYLYYKKFRKEQNRTRKPAGSIRLEDTYSIVPQEPPLEKTISLHDEQ